MGMQFFDIDHRGFTLNTRREVKQALL